MGFWASVFWMSGCFAPCFTESRGLLLLTNDSINRFDDMWNSQSFNDPYNNKSEIGDFWDPSIAEGDFKVAIDPAWGSPEEIEMFLFNDIGDVIGEFYFNVTDVNLTSLSNWVTASRVLYNGPHAEPSILTPTITDGEKEMLMADNSTGGAYFAIVHAPQWPTALLLAVNSSILLNTTAGGDLDDISQPVSQVLFNFTEPEWTDTVVINSSMWEWGDDFVYMDGLSVNATDDLGNYVGYNVRYIDVSYTNYTYVFDQTFISDGFQHSLSMLLVQNLQIEFEVPVHNINVSLIGPKAGSFVVASALYVRGIFSGPTDSTSSSTSPSTTSTPSTASSTPSTTSANSTSTSTPVPTSSSTSPSTTSTPSTASSTPSTTSANSTSTSTPVPTSSSTSPSTTSTPSTASSTPSTTSANSTSTSTPVSTSSSTSPSTTSTPSTASSTPSTTSANSTSTSTPVPTSSSTSPSTTSTPSTASSTPSTTSANSTSTSTPVSTSSSTSPSTTSTPSTASSTPSTTSANSTSTSTPVSTPSSTSPSTTSTPSTASSTPSTTSANSTSTSTPVPTSSSTSPSTTSTSSTASSTPSTTSANSTSTSTPVPTSSSTSPSTTSTPSTASSTPSTTSANSTSTSTPVSTPSSTSPSTTSTPSTTTSTPSTTSYTPTSDNSTRLSTPSPLPTSLSVTVSTTTATPFNNSIFINGTLYCPCVQPNITNNTNNTDLEEIVNELIANLTLDKHTLSSTTRKYTSAKDNRPSAKAAGAFAVVTIIMAASAVVIVDYTTLVNELAKIPKHYKQLKKRLSRRSLRVDDISTQMADNPVTNAQSSGDSTSEALPDVDM